MSGITDLQDIIRLLNPMLCDDEFVFLCRPHEDDIFNLQLRPIATISESEGQTLIVTKPVADAVGEEYSEVFRKITLQVRSSLQAVGLTAAVSTALAEQGIPANILAGFHHDHVFVPKSKADLAIDTLKRLCDQR